MPALRMASWNFRTTRTELSDDLQSIDNARMTAVIDMELDRLNFEIACLQKKQNLSLKEQRYMFFWQGKSPEENSGHVVGFAVKNTLLTIFEYQQIAQNASSLFGSQLKQDQSTS